MSDERKNRFVRAFNKVFLVKLFKANQIKNILINKITETGKLKWIFKKKTWQNYGSIDLG